MSASVLRHVSAEATYVGVFSGDAPHVGGNLRALLDARSEAHAAHGLEMRTERRIGEALQELTRRLAESPAQMLIVGVTELAGFAERFSSLLEGGRWPVLIVRRSSP
jgi:hypothetical protein